MTTETLTGRHVHNATLSADVFPEDDLVRDLTDSLRPRLTPTHAVELEQLVRAALEELAPVHVTNYLGVLVERRLRASGHAIPLASTTGTT